MSKCNFFGEIDENLDLLCKVREKVAELLKSLSHNDSRTTLHMSYIKDTRIHALTIPVAYFQCYLLERSATILTISELSN